VERCQGDLDGRLFLLGMDIDGDAAAVVEHADTLVLVHHNADVAAIPGQGLVNGIVYDLKNQMMQAAVRRIADIHRGPHADSFHPLQNLYRCRVILLVRFCHAPP